jgi:hypothetical protein
VKIREVASAAAGDQDFFSWFLGALEDCNAGAEARRFVCA